MIGGIRINTCAQGIRTPKSYTRLSRFTSCTKMDPRQHLQLHFVLIPAMAQGHMIPLIDMARLLAARGVIVTIATTTLAASHLKPVIDRTNESGLSIRLLHAPFPSKEVGLPEGCETLDGITSEDMVKGFFAAVDMLQQPLEKLLLQSQPPPSCIISSFYFRWTQETASKFHVPRFTFSGMCSFALLCIHTIRSLRLHESIASSTEPFVVPGLPHRIEVTRSQLPTSLSITSPDLKAIYQELREAEVAADGVLINSFEELETGYAKCFEESTGTKAWLLGPLSLVNKNASDKVYRGKGASASASECLNWLDLKPPKSVVYVSFGSMCRLTPSQLMAIGLGLEASNQPFIWVVRKNERSTEIEKWLEGGFEERVKERGLVIRGWAPQIMILSHPATGGFLTHCGWNSTLESICAGLPMITWPLYAEQFLNEKLVLQVLGIAISTNVKTASRLWQDSCTEEMVKMEDVKKAVETLMDGGREAEERRKRAKELGEKSRKAMELGGSSYASMTHLIQYVACKAQNNKPVAQE